VRTVRDGAVQQELAGVPVGSLTMDGRGGVLAIVGGRSLQRRSADATWTTIGTSELELAVCTPLGDGIFVGTSDARVLRLASNGSFEQLHGFDVVPGRDSWYAGSAVINGKVMGPPLGVRSMAATSDQRTLLVNVHVGGVPRSTDAGVTWTPTIDIECDVHQVCAHPTRPELVVAASAVGLCVSWDGGASWSIETEGMHARYCSAVAFSGDEILVSASSDHFASQGAIYRRPISGGPLRLMEGGLPRWLSGIADTGNLAASASIVAVADRAGNLYLSEDGAATWATVASRLPGPSSVLIC
jgi:hypothetical protein